MGGEALSCQGRPESINRSRERVRYLHDTMRDLIYLLTLLGGARGFPFTPKTVNSKH